MGTLCDFKKWQVTCDIPVYVGRKCILHSNDPTKDVSRFNAKLAERITNKDLDFRYCIFPDGYHFGERTFDAPMNFIGATFLGDANFTGFDFGSVARFSFANFRQRAVFTLAHFQANALFIGSAFSNESRFDQVDFKGDANFWMAHFQSFVTFYDSNFVKSGIFTEASFDDELEFTPTTTISPISQVPPSTVFHNQAFFDWTVFNSKTALTGVQFKRRTVFSYSNMENLSFRDVDLSNCHFGDANNLDKAEFERIQWGRWISRYGLIETVRPATADECDARSPDVRGQKDEERKLLIAEKVYRGLRASYENGKDHSRIGDFYFAEMEMRRLASSRRPFRQRILSILSLYGLFSGYGERWLRALGWFVALVILWGLLYLNTGFWVKSIGSSGPAPVASPVSFSTASTPAAPVAPSSPTPPIDRAAVSVGSAGSESKTYITYYHMVPQLLAIGGTPADFGQVLGGLGHGLIHSFLVATLIGRDTYAMPASWTGQVVQTVELVLGPLLLGLMALAIRRRFHR